VFGEKYTRTKFLKKFLFWNRQGDSEDRWPLLTHIILKLNIFFCRYKKMSDNDYWTALFLVFLAFLFMFVSFYNIRNISDAVYEGLSTQNKIYP